MSSGGAKRGAGVVEVVIIEGRLEPPVSVLALLLVVVRELLLAFPGDDADFGPSSNEEISTFAAVAGFKASSCVVDESTASLGEEGRNERRLVFLEGRQQTHLMPIPTMAGPRNVLQRI